MHKQNNGINSSDCKKTKMVFFLKKKLSKNQNPPLKKLWGKSSTNGAVFIKATWNLESEKYQEKIKRGFQE